MADTAPRLCTARPAAARPALRQRGRPGRRFVGTGAYPGAVTEEGAASDASRERFGDGLGNAAIADRLAAEGFHTPHLHERFNTGEIQHLIRPLGLRPGLDLDHLAGSVTSRQRQPRFT